MIFYPLHFMLFVVHVQLLSFTRRPAIVIACYTVATLAIGLLTLLGERQSLIDLLLYTSLRLPLSAAYFALLSRWSDSPLWWLVLPFGCIVAIV